jgi:hypothetical protein
MLSDPEAKSVPPVPSVWRLGWLLLMQPMALHQMHQTWGLENDPSLISHSRLGRTHNSVVRALIAKYALLLLIVTPFTALLVAGAMTLSNILIQVGIGTRSGAGGAALAVAGGAALAVALGVAFDLTFDVALGVTAIVANMVATIVAAVLVVGVAGDIADGMLGGVAAAMIGGVAGGAVGLRLPIWVAEVFLTQWLVWRMRRCPDGVRRLSTWLPFQHDDLIYVPLPGLYACLIQVAEIDPTLGKELIALAAASTGQHRIARLALIELQARDLERVARGRFFARAAGLDLPFLPRAADLASDDTNTPFVSFQNAARDLIAGSTTQRQRHLALERALKSLESFSTITARSRRPDQLARRLLGTADLWLDIIRDEDAKLTREAKEHPEVPSVFIAGPPLTPDRVEDRTLFKGRTDIIKLIDHDLGTDRCGVLLIVGQRRMGKTSLCHYLPAYQGTGTNIVVSNFQTLSGDARRETPHRRVLGDISARSLGIPEPPDSARWGEGLRWLEDLDRMCVDRKILVVIDELERVEDGIRNGWCSTDFLDFLRAAGDALRNIRFLLLTAYPLHRLGPHWTDRLVSVTSRTISYLDEGDARELLAHPIPEFPDIYPEGGIDLILAQTGRHPYLLQKAGDDLCRLLNSRGGLRAATGDELTEVFDGMVRDVQVFDEIWRSRTEDEQATLKRLARSDEPGNLDPAAIGLAREGYLERRGDKVAIAVPLFREWIHMNVV